MDYIDESPKQNFVIKKPVNAFIKTFTGHESKINISNPLLIVEIRINMC